MNRAVDLTIVIPNFDGESHLGPCLDSIAASIPAGIDVEVIVVDNGSTDDSELVVERARIPARWLPLGSNRGFAGAVNEGARAGRGRLLALLNNDMVVEPGWIEAMLAARGDDPEPRCVASVILDWDGTHADFVGASMNFHGFGNQPGHGLPIGDVELRAEELPFACGGAMLLDRDVFLDVDGFDERFFAYFEDVDLGWRLGVRGLPTVLAPDARVRHRHHGTSRRMAAEQRTLLLERNALRTVLRNVGDGDVHRFLSGALLLLVARTMDEIGSSRERYEPFGREVGSERVPATALARLHAVIDVLEDLPDLMSARAQVQGARAVADADVFHRFGTPIEAIGATSVAYERAFAKVVAALGIDEAFGMDQPSIADDTERIGSDVRSIRRRVGRTGPGRALRRLRRR